VAANDQAQKGGGVMSHTSEFYPLADALAMRFKVDLEVFQLEGSGDVTVDIGQFSIKLSLTTISSVIDNDGSVAMLIETKSGNLGLFVVYRPSTKRIEVSPVDLSILPKEGQVFFEDLTVISVAVARELSLSMMRAYRTFVMDYKQGWSEVCHEHSSSGTPSTEPPTP